MSAFSIVVVCSSLRVAVHLLTCVMATPNQIVDELEQRFKLDALVTEQILKAGVTTLSEFGFYCHLTVSSSRRFSPRACRMQGCRKPVFAKPGPLCVRQRNPGKRRALPVSSSSMRMSSCSLLTRKPFGAGIMLCCPKRTLLLIGGSLKLSERWQSARWTSWTSGTPGQCSSRGQPRSKRRRVAGSLYISEQGDEDDAGAGEQTRITYLQHLRVYLHALALPGASPLDPAPTERETPERSVDYVQVPLDVLLKYWFRCEKFALQLPERLRLSHLQNLDCSERAGWVQRYANITSTLGQCVLAVFLFVKELRAGWSRPGAACSPSSPASLGVRCGGRRTHRKFCPL